MRLRPLSLESLVFALGLSPLRAFVAPVAPETLRGIARRARARSPGASRLPESCPRAKSELFLTAKTPGDDGKQGEEEETAADDGTTELVVKKDAGVLAATGVTGALLGWSFAHSLDLDLDLAGAVSGCLVAVGLLGQEGTVGKATATLGQFALGAFEVVGLVAKSTDVPAKVAETVGEEFLEVVEFTSGAVTKGYMDSLPPPNVRLEAEIEASKKTVADLRGQLGKVNAALSDAKEQLAERAENQRVVNAAKTTAAELVEAKATLAERDAAIRENLRLARREKDAFDRDLRAAKDEAARFRKMAASRSDMDDNFKALAAASDTLEARVREYEGRLRVLTDENDTIRADYSAEMKSMETERASMRERISGLEASLTGAESRIGQQREALEKELALMADALDKQAAEAEASTRLAADMKAAVAKSEAKAAEAVEKVAAEAALRAAHEEKARTAEKARAMEAEAIAAQAAAEASKKAKVAERAAIAAEMQANEQRRQQRRMAEMARATEAAKKREAAEAKTKKAREEAAAKQQQQQQQKEKRKTQQQEQAARAERAAKQKQDKKARELARAQAAEEKAKAKAKAKAEEEDKNASSAVIAPKKASAPGKKSRADTPERAVAAGGRGGRCRRSG